MSNQPTVLPWHREAAKSLYEAKHNNYIGAGMIAHIIAGYDPHAETLRLLEGCINHPRMKSAPMAEVSDEYRERIMRHIAAMKGTP